MPRYFFHLYDGTETRDPDGLELPDIEAARVVATHELRQLATYEVHRGGGVKLSDRIDIVDESGRVLDNVCYADIV